MLAQYEKSLEEVKSCVDAARKTHEATKPFGDPRPYNDMGNNEIFSRQNRVTEVITKNECYAEHLKWIKNLSKQDQDQRLSEMQQMFFYQVNKLMILKTLVISIS